MPAKHGYLIPEIIDPPRICIQLEIPNEPAHLRAFWGQLDALGSALTWDNDEDHTALLIAAVWRDVYEVARAQFYGDGCMGCCPDENIISYNTWYNQQVAYQQYLQMMDDGNTAASFNAPSNFNGAGTPNETYAMCRVVNAIVSSALRGQAMALTAITDLISEIAGALPFVQPIQGIVMPLVQGMVRDHFQELVEDCAAIREVACCMTTALGGLPTTIANLQSSLDGCGFTFGTHEAEIAGIVRDVLRDDNNARAAIASMRQTFDQIGTQGAPNQNDCDCDCPCDSSNFQPVDFLSTGCNYEYLGNCIWRILSVAPESGHNASIRDAQNRIFRMDTPDPSLGYPLAGCSDVTIVGACGDPSYTNADCNFTTGVWSGMMTEVSWASGQGAWNYYKITVIGTECP